MHAFRDTRVRRVTVDRLMCRPTLAVLRLGLHFQKRHGPEVGIMGTVNPKYHQPVVRVLKALYGHPDSGTYWEKHCDTK